MLSEIILGLMMIIIEKFDEKRINKAHEEVIIIEKKIDKIEEESKETNKEIKKLNENMRRDGKRKKR